MPVEINDFTEDVLAALNRQMEAALEAVGQQAVSHAKSNITRNIPRNASGTSTGALKNSITHQVVMSEKAVYIGTNIHYAIYNELGTGIYTDGGGGRQTPWVYFDAQGKAHRTRGIKPIHFLKDAAQDHGEEYRRIFEQYLKK